MKYVALVLLILGCAETSAPESLVGTWALTSRVFPCTLTGALAIGRETVDSFYGQFHGAYVCPDTTPWDNPILAGTVRRDSIFFLMTPQESYAGTVAGNGMNGVTTIRVPTTSGDTAIYSGFWDATRNGR